LAAKALAMTRAVFRLPTTDADTVVHNLRVIAPARGAKG